jgi:putative Mg2+ transporter-C (MgtC) family protein
MISDLEITERLAVAAVLGCAIGFERERLLWAAGIRTHMLVSVGACLLMIVSAYGFQHVLAESHVILDPSRIAAQVVSGIGFLGAGAILLRGQVVRGLTTAASIWAVAAVGLAAGGGLFFAAAISTAIILAILAGMKPLEEIYRSRAQSGCHRGDRRAGRDRVGPDQEAEIALARVSSEDISRGVERLRREPGVHSVDVVPKKRSKAEPVE